MSARGGIVIRRGETCCLVGLLGQGKIFRDGFMISGVLQSDIDV